MPSVWGDSKTGQAQTSPSRSLNLIEKQHMYPDVRKNVLSAIRQI